MAFLSGYNLRYFSGNCKSIVFFLENGFKLIFRYVNFFGFRILFSTSTRKKSIEDFV